MEIMTVCLQSAEYSKSFKVILICTVSDISVESTPLTLTLLFYLYFVNLLFVYFILFFQVAR